MNTYDDFELMFAEAYPSFTKNLVKTYSNLTYNELRLCMYLRMGYPSYKILKILNISSSTLSNLRSGIRKKMGLTRNQNLTNIILCV
jgi:DNA-binding CsgD family transcriptional regulator